MSTIAVELRLLLLESLCFGSSRAHTHPEASLTRRLDVLLRAFNTALDSNGSEALRRFVDSFEINEALLKPPLPVSPSAQAHLLPASVRATLVLEAQADIQALERDLRELEVLEKRGIAGAGSLAVTQELEPDLRELQADISNGADLYSKLEERVTALLVQYDEYVHSVSSTFVRMNAVLSDAERTLTLLEREST